MPDVLQLKRESDFSRQAPLFEALQNQLLVMCEQMENHKQRGRITKMLLSTSFRRDFERAKTTVLELKATLRDFLDQESQDAQEAKLEVVRPSTNDTSTAARGEKERGRLTTP
eukprot:scaffold581_cov263-Pinguiococcus_pyrenoidosus.AAC.12